MATLFYVSIGFNAPNGAYPGNGTFIRPVDEGFAVKIAGKQISSSVSPLLISSVSSSVMYVCSLKARPHCTEGMSLVAERFWSSR